jgi:galactose mutarotase-like enzyme
MRTYSIKNDQVSVSINAAGAELCSFKDINGKERIWQGEASIWARHAPVLFPIVGKLKNNSYTCEGITYSLPQHGFARDMDFLLTEQDNYCLVFELKESEESLKQYPFRFSLKVRYELKGKTLSILYTVSNPGNEILPFSLGAHPGFNCKLSEGENLEDFVLEFKKQRLVVHELKEGLISNTINTLDLKNGSLNLNSVLFDNDALVFKNGQVDEVMLRSCKTLFALKLSCKHWPYFGIWTKKGTHDFICLEPWYGVADTVNTSGNIYEKEGIQELNPGARFSACFEMEFL